jgi:glutamyl-tRNA reductase
MKRLALIGVSQRRGGTAALEGWTQWVQGFSWPAEWVGEVVPIATCNRCDVVLTVPEGAELEELRNRLIPAGLAQGYAFSDEAALEQLCRIAASLDSLNPGEDQIMNQIRIAFEQARQAGTVGPISSFAFQTALRIAKRVRREVPLAPAHTSLFSLAKPELLRLLPGGATVAILGTGEMGTLAARSLAANPSLSLLLVNRTLVKAQALAEELRCEAMSLEDFLHQARPVQALVCATPIEHLVGAAVLAGRTGLKAIVDLGLPRNADPLAAKQAGVRLFDLEHLQALGEERRAKLHTHLAQAEQVIAEELETALDEWAERSLGSAISGLRQKYKATLEQVVGGQLDPAVIQQLVNRFAHVPIKGLRGLARRHGLAAAQTFLEEAELEVRGG